MLHIYETETNLINVSWLVLGKLDYYSPDNSSFYTVISSYSYILGLAFKEEQNKNIIKIKIRVLNKFKLFIFKKVIKYTIIETNEKISKCGEDRMSINVINKKLSRIELDKKAEEFGLSERYWVSNIVYYGSV